MFNIRFDGRDSEFQANFGTRDTFVAEFSTATGVAQKYIHADTTAGWDSEPDTVGFDGHLYVYTDYTEVDNEPVPGIKAGDGRTLLINLPFIAGNMDAYGSGLPSGGQVGDVLMKVRDADDGGGWVTPASSAEQDNTRPITAAAVYTEIGNINALLATI